MNQDKKSSRNWPRALSLSTQSEKDTRKQRFHHHYEPNKENIVNEWGNETSCCYPKALIHKVCEEEGKNILKSCQNVESPVQAYLDSCEVKGIFSLVPSCRSFHALVLKTDKPLRYNEYKFLLDVFQKLSTPGFLEWLGGAKGWRYEEDGSGQDKLKWKQQFVIILNSLQDCFKLYAPPDQVYMPDSKEMTWKKGSNLKQCVADIRLWLETISYNSKTVNKLFRSSKTGPDGPLHWSHHHPNNLRYGLTIVSKGSMTELVNTIVEIFRSEFDDKTSEIPLGTRWRHNTSRRQTDWKVPHDFDWSVDRLEALLNGFGTFQLEHIREKEEAQRCLSTTS